MAVTCESDDITCPFCGEEGFDKIGLKDHLINYCEVYEQIELLKHFFT